MVSSSSGKTPPRKIQFTSTDSVGTPYSDTMTIHVAHLAERTHMEREVAGANPAILKSFSIPRHRLVPGDHFFGNIVETIRKGQLLLCCLIDVRAGVTKPCVRMTSR